MFTLLEEYDVQATRKEAREEGKQEGIQIGVERGKQEGIQIGVERGKQEGRRESRIEIAKKLIKTSDIYTVAEITGLPIEVVKELAENN